MAKLPALPVVDETVEIIPPTAGVPTPPLPPVENKTRANATILAIRTDIPMPTGKALGERSRKYNFDALEVGHCIEVAGATAKNLLSVINAENRIHLVQAMNDDGTPQFKTVKGKTEPVMKANKRFVAFDCDPAVNNGVSVRIFRTI